MPLQTALHVLLLNRFDYNACKDWTVWRENIRYHTYLSKLQRPAETDCRSTILEAICHRRLKSTLHGMAGYTTSDIKRWFPQLIALKRKPAKTSSSSDFDSADPVTLSMNTTSLDSVCNLHIPHPASRPERSTHCIHQDPRLRLRTISHPRSTSLRFVLHRPLALPTVSLEIPGGSSLYYPAAYHTYTKPTERCLSTPKAHPHAAYARKHGCRLHQHSTPLRAI